MIFSIYAWWAAVALVGVASAARRIVSLEYNDRWYEWVGDVASIGWKVALLLFVYGLDQFDYTVVDALQTLNKTMMEVVGFVSRKGSI